MTIKREIIKTVCVIAGMLVLFAAGVLLPYGLRDAKLKQEINTARDQLGINGVENAGLVKLYNEVEALRKKLDGRGQYIPDEDGIAKVLQDFSGLTNAPGVSGQETNQLESNYYADYNIMPVRIQFSAPALTAYDMVKRIETLSRVVRIDHFTIEADTEYPRQPLTVNLELSAFFTAEGIGGGQ